MSLKYSVLVTFTVVGLLIAAGSTGVVATILIGGMVHVTARWGWGDLVRLLQQDEVGDEEANAAAAKMRRLAREDARRSLAGRDQAKVAAVRRRLANNR